MEESEGEMIKWFSEIQNNEKTPNVGIKGADLAELYKAGFPVPNGFVITGDAYKYFIEKANLGERVKKLHAKIAEDAQNSEEIRALVMDATLPKQLEEAILENYEALNAEKLKTSDVSVNTFLKNSTEPTFVAVRASPAKEENNSYEHAINVKGNQRLISAVKRCFASYAKTHGVSETENPPGIIIQKMIDADKAGVSYAKDKETLQVEAVFGIREGDRVDSDIYHINDSGNISKTVNLKKVATTRNSQGDKITVDLPEDIAQKQVLNDLEIKKIAETAKKIAEHHKSPRKVEFAIEKKELFVLETKPHEVIETVIEEKPVEELPQVTEEKIASLSKEIEESTKELEALQSGEYEERIQNAESMIEKLKEDLELLRQKERSKENRKKLSNLDVW